MSDLRALLDAPALVVTGWGVVFSVWSTTMAALALAVWRTLRPRAQARHQYRAAAISLAGAFVLSGAMLVVLLATAGRSLAPDVAASVRIEPPSAVTAAPARIGSRSGTPADPTRRAPSPSSPATRVPATGLALLGICWLVGLTLCAARLFGGWLVAGRLGRGAALVDDGPLRAAFDRVTAAVGVRRVRLAVSWGVDAPVTVGVTKPTVVLPGHLLDCLPPDSFEPILAHELAHVARRDYAANLVQCAVEALLYHSPATWWIGHRIRDAREFACDDCAVATAGDRARYVEALVLVARLGASAAPRPIVGMAGPRLITRVRRLLEGEPAMNAPVLRAAAAAACGLLLALVLPLPFDVASAQLSARLFAAGATQDQFRVPIGFPQRQDGSALRIHRVDSTSTHACGSFDVENVADVAVSRVRVVGVLSFARGANRPVQIVESDWIETTIAPGTTARLEASLVDLAIARREAAGSHVQVLCALREVVHANRASWSVTPNPAATNDRDAMGWPAPSLPRQLVGVTSALPTPRLTLCVDDAGSEYSPGARIAIRNEPGRAARCASDGQWAEVDPGTGSPVGSTRVPAEAVVMELRVAGIAAQMSLQAFIGTAATVQLPTGQAWGFVPARTAGGSVDVALHDLSTRPHRHVATRSLSPGQTVLFDDVEPALTLRLAPR